MRKLLVLLPVALLVGCTTAPTDSRVWYDRKYNEYRHLTGQMPTPHGTRAAAPAAGDSNAADVIQQQTRRMHEQMEKMMQTQDPAERQRLMREHMHAMQAHAQTMRGMPECMMMGMMDRK